MCARCASVRVCCASRARGTIRGHGRESYVTRPRCGAQTAAGRPCTKPAMVNSSRCQLHQGGWSSYGVAQRKKKEAEAKMRKLRKRK
ncbi:HGGxSTG domain-containing protein [Streptomyces virginiae]|uniref:HGGxSTG domain-containing protein n=1 Tax=Streptomyces virginiae TaxID=1961 RepID=UPI00371C8D31